jgi:hypothetical protein
MKNNNEITDAIKILVAGGLELEDIAEMLMEENEGLELEYDEDEEAILFPGFYVRDGNGELDESFDTRDEAADEFAETFDEFRKNKTIWVHCSTFQYGVGHAGILERYNFESHKVTLDPDEPDCVEGEEHEWINERVMGSGGGVLHGDRCKHCGLIRITDSWAQDPEDGEQGLDSVEYREKE